MGLELEVEPQNIADIVDRDVGALKLITGGKLKKKLEADMVVIDVGNLLDMLCPALTDPNAKVNAVVLALEVVTGRRSIEILSSAEFYLDKTMTRTGYRTMFKGQAKSALFPTKDFEIPLLAPFHIVQDALIRVRKAVSPVIKGLDNAQVNLIFARGLSDTLESITHLNITPHGLELYMPWQHINY